jgi:ribonucleoside-diphosphate reductase alpha chain
MISWRKGVDYPEFLTEIGLTTLKKGYLIDSETPTDMYKRIARRFTELTNNQEVGQRIFEYLWKNWLCPATPVAANFGTSRGFPISCYVTTIQDSTYDINNANTEIAMLTKGGGGVGTNWSRVRAAGSVISTGGHSEGIIPFLHVTDSLIVATSQGSTRRGAASANLDVYHGDFDDFLSMRRGEGDPLRRNRNLHHCVTIPNDFMEKLPDRNLEKWVNILKTRMETGEPYIAFPGNIGRSRPEWYKDYRFEGTNICSEIIPFLKEDETFTCCLSSVNIARWDEWKNDPLFIADCIYFLDTVLDDFIEKAKHPVYKKAVNFAKRHRSIGLGWLGLHTYLQEHNIPFVSISHKILTDQIGKKIWEEGWEASRFLAKNLGEPDVTKGYGVRNAQLFAIAPTTSNSIISGGVSQGIEPLMSNYTLQKTSKGTFVRVNPTLERLLKEKYNKSDAELENIWEDVNDHGGSVQHLSWFDEKEVFKTFGEIDQRGIIELAAQRQKYVDQSQSLNLCFPNIERIPAEERNAFTAYINQCHLLAHEKGIKTLYYVRTNSSLKGDTISNKECVFCEA